MAEFMGLESEMAEPLVVVGASGFGRETLDVAEAINAAAPLPVWDILGVVDDNPSQVNLLRLKERDVAHSGRSKTCADTRASGWSSASAVRLLAGPSRLDSPTARPARPP